MTKEQKRAYNKAWKASHPQAVQMQRKKFRENRPGYHKKRYRDEATGARKRHLKWHFKAKYGITREQRDALFVAQGSRCASCGTFDPGSKKGWATDHSHATGKVRGIVCPACNTIEGYAKGNPAQLRAVADYLERTDEII